MDNKRITIYDLAKEMNLSASYISKALNNHPSVSEKVKENVKKKAEELKYKHNSYAANLRKGISRTIGVVVPYIDRSFFSKAIAGIEEVCSEQDYGLIICQSHDLFEKECKVIDTLIRQNVDCILISVSAETQSFEHLNNIVNNDIKIIQFDKFVADFDSFKVINDNEGMAYSAVRHLISRGFRKIVYLGGTEHLMMFKLRKRGYIRALEESNLPVSSNLIFDNALSKERAAEIATQLLSLSEAPDAFFAVTDHQALSVLQVANSLGINVPVKLGVIGLGNDDITKITKPTMSTIEQKSMELGRRAANLYFEILAKENDKKTVTIREEIVPVEIIVRESTARTEF